MDLFSSNWLPAMRKPFEKKKREFTWGKSANPTALSWCTNMAAILLNAYSKFSLASLRAEGLGTGSQRGIRACHVRERLLGNSRAEQEWGKLKLSVLEKHTKQIVAGHERHWTSESRFDTFQRTSRDSRLSCLPPARWLFRLAEPSALRRCEPALLPWKLKIPNFTGKMASLREASKTGLTYVYAG